MKPKKAYFKFQKKEAIIRPSKIGSFSVHDYFIKTQLFILEIFSKLHLVLRKPHDQAYKNIKIYKNYSDHPASGPINRSVAAGFVASLAIFLTLQYVVPNLFDTFKPNKAEASSTSKQWTLDTDFNNNTPTTGVATNRVLAVLPGTSSVTLGSKTVTGTGTDFTTSVNTYSPKEVAINGISYAVASVESNTSLTLRDNYPTATASGLALSHKSDTALLGTATLVSGSAAVVGVGTNFNTSVKKFASPILIRISGTAYTVSTVTDDTHLTLSANSAVSGAGLPISYDNAVVGNNAVSLHSGPVATTLTYGLGGNVGKTTAGTYSLAVPAGITGFTVDIKGAGGGGDTGGGAAGTAGGVTKLSYSTYDATANSGSGTGVVGTASISGFTGLTAVSGQGNAGGAGGYGTPVYYDGGCQYDSCDQPYGCWAPYWDYGPLGASGGAGGRITGSITTAQVAGQTLSVVVGAGGGGYTAGSIGTIVVTYFTTGYNSTGTLSGLKIDSGSNVKSKWNTVSWVGTTTGAGTNPIKFRTRGSNMASPTTVTGSADTGWTYWNNDATNVAYYTSTGATLVTIPTRWLEIEATLTTSDITVTPSLTDFTINYDTLDAPTNLAQYKADTTTAISANYTNETSFVAKANLGVPLKNSTPITPQFEIRTTDTGWTGAVAVPAGVTATPTSIVYTCTVDPCAALGVQTVGTITGLTAGTSYYYRVRTTDATGRVSGWSASSSFVNPDQAAPTIIAFVNDGTSADIIYSSSLSQLSANWGASTDAISGLQKYQYAIGTTSGGTNTLTWTDNGTATAVTKTGLSLVEGTTYYFTVRAVDNVGNTSLVTTSNGQLVDVSSPTGTISIKDTESPYSDNYSNAKLVKLILTPVETGSGMKDFQLSNDGVTWGTATSTLGVVTNSGTWGTWSDAYNSTGFSGWYLSGADGSKSVYVKYRDVALNVSGTQGSYSPTASTSWTIPNGIASINFTFVGAGGGGCYGPRYKHTGTSGGNGGDSGITIGANIYKALGGTGATGEYDSDCGIGTDGGTSFPAGFVPTQNVTGGAGNGGPNPGDDYYAGGPGGAGGLLAGTIGVSGGSATISVGAMGSPNGGAGSVLITYSQNISATTTLDTTAPTAAITYSLSRNVKTGDVQRITATFNEDILAGTLPKVAISGSNTLAATDMVRTDATHYYYDYTVGAGNGASTIALSVGTDLAGNVVTSAPTSGATFTVDNVLPTITSATSTTANGYYKAANIVNVTVNFSEIVSSIGSVTVNLDSGGACSFIITNSNSGSCNYTVGASDNSSDLNTSSISGNIKDLALNTLTNFAPAASLASSKAIVIDTTAPTAAITYSLSRNVKTGDVQRITATFNEAMLVGTLPKVAISGSNTLAATDMVRTDATHYYYDYTVGAGNGASTIALSVGTDLAGNVVTSAPTSGATFTIDNIVPTLTTVTIASNNTINHVAKMGNQITLTIVASESVTTPTVIIAGNSATVTGTGTNYSAVYTMVSGDTQGTVLFSISAFQDSALNTGSVVSTNTGGNNITYDRTNPDQITITSVSPATNNTGEQTVTWADYTDSAPTSGFGKYVLQRKKSTDVDFSDISPSVEITSQSTHTYLDHIAQSSNSSGTYYYRVIAYDRAGNSSNGAASQAVVIDNQAPAGTLHILDTVNGTDPKATKNSTVNLSFILTDDYSGVSSYSIDNGDGNWSESTDISSDGLSHSGTYTGWALVNPSTEGTKTVRIKLADKAGNEVTNISHTIILDTTSPDSISSVVAYSDDTQETSISETGDSLGWYPYTGPNFKFISSDQVSGIKEFKYCIYRPSSESCDYTANSAVSASQINNSKSYTGNVTLELTDFGNNNMQGELLFKVIGVDYVGKTSAPSTYTYKFDNTVPTYVNNFSATQGTYTDKIVLTWDKSSNITPVAPIEKYKIERVQSSYYNGINDSDWTQFINYQNITCQTATPYVCLDKDGVQVGNISLDGSSYKFENKPEVDGISSTSTDASLLSSTKYIYRISAKDYSNEEYGPVPANGNQNQFEVYGYTKDTESPGVLPTDVTAVTCDGASVLACNDDLAMRGRRVYVSWAPAEDNISAIDYYDIYRREGGPNDLNGWDKVGTLPETTDNEFTKRVFYDDTVVDAKSYSYRIVAVDKARPLPANATEIVPGGMIDNIENATQSAVYVYDITPPVVPTSFTVQPKGIDCFDVECTPKQMVGISWQETTDNTPSNNISYELYRSLSATSGFGEVAAAATISPDNTGKYFYEDKALDDRTTYYYYLRVIDGHENSANTTVMVVTTGNSSAPTPPKDVLVSNSDSSLTDQAHQLRVSFVGSYARGFDSVTKENGIVGYDSYISQTNIIPDMLQDPTDGTTNNCIDNETADDCWIRINNATVANTQTLTTPIGDDSHIVRAFTAANLTETTQYYFRIRAVDNGKNIDGSDAPLKSLFTAVTPLVKKSGGWEVTRDLTVPPLPTGGLEVKVTNTHPNTTVLRNIVTWKILSEKPLRKKLPFEIAYNATTNPKGCKAVAVNGVDYCNDFYSFELYREVLDVDNNVIYESSTPIKTEINPETNFYIDEIGNTDLIGGTGDSSFLIDAKIRYYVKVVDSSIYNFNYPDGTSINALPNKTERQDSGSTIIPAKSIPSILGLVTVSDIGVSSATVSWTTNQSTDAVVEFRKKYKNGNSGELNDGTYQVIGENSNPVIHVETENHAVQMFGLQAETEYDYRVVSKNYLANTVYRSGNDVPTLKTKGFTITYLPNRLSTTTVSAELRWSTNMPSNSNMVEFRESNGTQNGAVAETPLKTEEVTTWAKNCEANPNSQLCSHSVIISPLKKSTEYTINIVSVSLDNYNTSSGLQKFTTASSDSKQFTVKPSASNVAERNITATSAQIVFQTAESTTATLYYDVESGAPTYEPKDYKLTATDALNSTTHQILVDGLEPGKKYYYIVKVDNGLLSYTSPESSFTAVLKPKISNLKVAEVKPYSFQVTWETNIDTETLINLGAGSANYSEKRGKPGLVKSHDLMVDQLTDNTEYHYQILAKDDTGNEVASSDSIIRTPLDTEGPKISGVKVDILPMGENDTKSSVIISWITDKPATTLVEYDKGVIGGDYGNRSVEDTSLNNSHTVIIKGLDPAASYHYRIISKDKRNNITESQDYTFVTPSREKSILQLILKSFEETFAWTQRLNEFFGSLGKRFAGK
ncbi:MAG: fibronectin type III domain-containing protein [bacterium]